MNISRDSSAHGAMVSTSERTAGTTDFGFGSTTRSRDTDATARTNPGRSTSRCVTSNDDTASGGANVCAIRAK